MKILDGQSGGSQLSLQCALDCRFLAGVSFPLVSQPFPNRVPVYPSVTDGHPALVTVVPSANTDRERPRRTLPRRSRQSRRPPGRDAGPGTHTWR